MAIGGELLVEERDIDLVIVLRLGRGEGGAGGQSGKAEREAERIAGQHRGASVRLMLAGVRHAQLQPVAERGRQQEQGDGEPRHSRLPHQKHGNLQHQ